jgi:hypothetical protein
VALGCRNRAGNARWSKVERGGIDIGENRRGPDQDDNFCGGAERECRANHGVARTDALRHQHEHQRVRATATADRVTRAAKRGQRTLELGHLRPLDELAMRRDAGNGVVDGAAQPATLGADVDERDRSRWAADALVHQVFSLNGGSAGGPAWPLRG